MTAGTEHFGCPALSCARGDPACRVPTSIEMYSVGGDADHDCDGTSPPCVAIQPVGSTADTCTCDSLGGIQLIFQFLWRGSHFVS